MGTAFGIGFGGGFGASKWTPARLSPLSWSYADNGANAYDAGAPAETMATFASGGSLAGYAQATKAYQPTITTVNGAKAPTLSGAARFPAAYTLAQCRCLHDGTGMTLWFCSYQTDAGGANARLFNQIGGVTTRAGINIVRVSTNKLTLAIGNGTATVFNSTSAGTIYAQNARYITVVRYSETAATKVDLRWNGASIISGATSAAPSSGDAYSLPALGSDIGWSVYWAGPIVETGFCNSYLSDANVALLEAWLARWPATI
jgi:hypothetical protein